jgi:hypothetical protein
MSVGGVPSREHLGGLQKRVKRKGRGGPRPLEFSVTNIGCLNPSVVITAFLNAIAFVTKPRLKMTKSSRKEMSWT